MVYGVYDVVAKVEADTMDKLKEIVTWHVRRLDKVRQTLTTLVTQQKTEGSYLRFLLSNRLSLFVSLADLISTFLGMKDNFLPHFGHFPS